MALSDRIAEALESSGLTKAELARATGTTGASVTHWLSGKTQHLKAETAMLMEQATGHSAKWLISGTGPKLVSAIQTKRLDRRVPVISNAAAATYAAKGIESDGVTRYLPVTSDNAGAYALRVTGDSMVSPHGKSYPPGCYVVVDPSQLNPRDGDRIVALLKATNEVTVKVFKSEDGRRWLAPLNPSHLPIRASFDVLGTVVGKWEDE
jgi:SOS-response transcriptional repressor LexA